MISNWWIEVNVDGMPSTGEFALYKLRFDDVDMMLRTFDMLSYYRASRWAVLCRSTAISDRVAMCDSRDGFCLSFCVPPLTFYFEDATVEEC